MSKTLPAILVLAVASTLSVPAAPETVDPAGSPAASEAETATPAAEAGAAPETATPAPVDRARLRDQIEQFQAVIENALRQDLRSTVLSAPRGAYLEGYGAVFSTEASLYRIRPLTPFSSSPYSRQELEQSLPGRPWSGWTASRRTCARPWPNTAPCWSS